MRIAIRNIIACKQKLNSTNMRKNHTKKSDFLPLVTVNELNCWKNRKQRACYTDSLAANGQSPKENSFNDGTVGIFGGFCLISHQITIMMLTRMTFHIFSMFAAGQ